MFLLDTNIYISFYERSYPIIHFPKFWKEFTNILNTQIVIPKIVVSENYQSDWFVNVYLKNNFRKDLIDQRLYKKEWAEILQYIFDSPLYREEALKSDRGWANVTIADGWLIAIAKKENYVIVTDELPNVNLNVNQPTKNPKIPDIAKYFNVTCISRLEFFRQINLKV